MLPIKILVIDDELVICEGCRLAFADTFHSVTSCMNGRTGREALMSAPYDLVLLDIKLPDMDGMGLLKEIRKKHPEVYVIVMTGFSTKVSCCACSKCRNINRLGLTRSKQLILV